MQPDKQYIDEYELCVILNYTLCKKPFVYRGQNRNLNNESIINLFILLNNLHKKYNFELNFNPKDVFPTNKEYLINNPNVVKGAKEIISKIKANYQSNKDLLENISIPDDDVNKYIRENAIITTEAGKKTEAKIKTFLSQYMNDFENGELFTPKMQIPNLAFHYEYYIDRVYPDVPIYPRKNFYIKIDHDPELKPIEFFLYLQDKEIIKIKNIELSRWVIIKTGDLDKRQTVKITIHILKDIADANKIIGIKYNELPKNDKANGIDKKTIPSKLPDIHYNKTTGIGYANEKRFKFTTGSPEFNVFATMYKYINKAVSREKVLSISGYGKKASSTEESLKDSLLKDNPKRKSSDHTYATYFINELAKKIRKRTSLNIDQVVNNNGNLTLTGIILKK